MSVSRVRSFPFSACLMNNKNAPFGPNANFVGYMDQSVQLVVRSGYSFSNPKAGTNAPFKDFSVLLNDPEF